MVLTFGGEIFLNLRTLFHCRNYGVLFYYSHLVLFRFWTTESGESVCLALVLFVICFVQVARSRARFFRGDRDLLLYTGRAHFFNRYCIRGIHHLIFYSLPEYPQFYPEMVNLLEVSFLVRFVVGFGS